VIFDVSKKRFANIIVAAVVGLNTIFAAAVLYVFCKVASEPTALIAAWFSFTTGELWMLASIKKTKVSQNNNKEGVSNEGDSN